MKTGCLKVGDCVDIQIKKLTPALVADYFRFFEEIAFADHPEWGCECYCCFFHATDAQEWKDRTVAQNKIIAREMILAGSMQGLLAYIDDKPVAWCHFEQKDRLPGLGVFYPQLVDKDADERIASVVCFTVAQGYRGQGIAGKMLDQACQELASQGYSVVEAYPILKSESAEENYHGPFAMYLAHGFTILKEHEKQSIVRKKLAP